MVGTIILSIFVILAILSFVVSFKYQDERFTFIGVMISVLAIFLLIVMLMPPRQYVDECVVNTTQEPLKVVYVQYHPFTENTCDDVVILPGQSKLLHKVKIAEKITYKFDSLCK